MHGRLLIGMGRVLIRFLSHKKSETARLIIRTLSHFLICRESDLGPLKSMMQIIRFADNAVQQQNTRSNESITDIK